MKQASYIINIIATKRWLFADEILFSRQHEAKPFLCTVGHALTNAPQTHGFDARMNIRSALGE